MSEVSQLCQIAAVLHICVVFFFSVFHQSTHRPTCVSAQAVFARGISAVWENYICVGEYCINAGSYKMRFKKTQLCYVCFLEVFHLVRF